MMQNDDSQNNDDLTKLLVSVGAAVTFTGVNVWYAWQIILGIPWLVTIIGIVTGLSIALLDLLVVARVALSVIHHYYKVKDEVEVLRGNKQLNQFSERDRQLLP